MRFILAVLALAGCSSAGADGSGATRTDSAGVEIVSSGGTDKPLSWTFTEVDMLRDSAGEPYLFTNVSSRDVVVDEAGRTIVLVGRSLVRFDAEGRYEMTVGRRGGGPGEMQLPRSLMMNGDTVLVHDLLKESLVRWTSALKPIGDRRLDGELMGIENVAFHDGGMWLEKDVRDDSLTRTLLLPDTAGSAALHRVSVPSTGAADFGCIRLSGMPPLFSPDLVWSASGPRIAVSAGSAFEIWLHEGTRALMSIRRSVPARAPTIEDANLLYPGGMKVAFPTGECLVPLEDIVDQLKLAETFPAIHDMRLLADGSLWVQRTVRNAETPVLDVFDSTGAYVGTVHDRRLPSGILPNGELLIPRDDEDTGGTFIARVRVTR